MSWRSAKTAIAETADLFGPLRKMVERVGNAGRPIFALHRVLPTADTCYDPEMVTSCRVFAQFLDWIVSRYQVLSLEDLASRPYRGAPGHERFCALTFDDGWHDNYVHAFPLLRDRGLPATIFLAVRFIGTARRFWQERLWHALDSIQSSDGVQEAIRAAIQQLPWCRALDCTKSPYRRLRGFLLSRSSGEAEEFVDCLCEAAGWSDDTTEPAFLSWQEVEAMGRAGITFGSHTLNHTLLSRTDPLTTWREIDESRRELAGRLGSPPESISFPWGAIGPYTIRQTKDAGFRYGVTTEFGTAGPRSERFLLPRILISDSAVCDEAKVFHPATAKLLEARANFGSARRTRKRSGIKHLCSERIRIGFVIDAIDSWQDGGTERQLAEVISALDRSYFEPELYFLRPSRYLKPDDYPCRVHVAGAAPEVRWYRFGTFWRLVRLLKARKPHIVQTFFRDGTYYGILAARLARIRVAVVGVRNAGYWKRVRDLLPVMAVNSLADYWQCNSLSVSETLESDDRIPGDRIDVLPNAIDLNEYAPPTREERILARQQLALPPDAPVFVSTANLVPVKDHKTLLEAAARLHHQLPTAQYLLVGGGPLRESLQAQAARLGLAESIRFVGTQRDVRPYLMAADLGLLASTSEASSNSVLEYMATGLPAVLTEISGNRELVEGVFFKRCDALDMADKILRLYREPERRADLSRDYRRRALRHGKPDFVRRAQSYYTGLLQNARTAS